MYIYENKSLIINIYYFKIWGLTVLWCSSLGSNELLEFPTEVTWVHTHDSDICYLVKLIV